MDENIEEALEDLTRPEHLLVWALRAIAIGHDDCPFLIQTFERACGPAGAAAFGAYSVIVKTVGMVGRRRFRVHAPGCPRVSLDEKTFVGVVAAAQASLEQGDDTLLRLKLEFLVEQRSAASLMFAAQAVAQVFTAAGHRLPMDPAPAPFRVAGRRLATVH